MPEGDRQERRERDRIRGSTFDRTALDLEKAIDTLMAEHLFGPALILMYASIDIMAWLAMEDGRDVRGKDFKAWSARYLLAEKHYPFTVEDLWGARCGLLHNHSSESKWSRQGRARQLFYAWGNRTAAELNAAIEIAEAWDAVAVQVEDLWDAVQGAFRRFRDDVNRNHDLRRRVEERSRFVLVTVFPPSAVATRRPRVEIPASSQEKDKSKGEPNMAKGPFGSAELTEKERLVVEEFENLIDDDLRNHDPSTPFTYVWDRVVPLNPAQKTLLRQKYLNAGWSRVSVSETASGDTVVWMDP